MKSKVKLLFITTISWTTFTVGLICWWLFFIIGGIRSWMSQPLSQELAHRYERMLQMEGSVLILLLISGGIALLIAFWKVNKERERVEKFFVVFTHELKTSLARLRLQTELLEENSFNLARIQQLQEDAVRIQVQLENALWMSRGFGDRIFLERVKLGDYIEHLKRDWPSLKFIVDADYELQIEIERRLFQNIFQNLIQNALVHGEATEIYLQITKKTAEQLDIKFTDNGKGFTGDVSRLGELYSRHTTSSGTGIGLYVIKESVKKLGGDVIFPNEAQDQRQKFAVELVLPQSNMPEQVFSKDNSGELV